MRYMEAKTLANLEFSFCKAQAPGLKDHAGMWGCHVFRNTGQPVSASGGGGLAVAVLMRANYSIDSLPTRQQQEEPGKAYCLLTGALQH